MGFVELKKMYVPHPVYQVLPQGKKIIRYLCVFSLISQDLQCGTLHPPREGWIIGRQYARARRVAGEPPPDDGH